MNANPFTYDFPVHKYAPSYAQSKGLAMTSETQTENESQPFSSVSEFIDALNAYKGDNIWQELIYGTEIEGDSIDEERSTAGTGDVIYLTSGDTIVYYEAEKSWR
jgi:hypothetical protein